MTTLLYRITIVAIGLFVAPFLSVPLSISATISVEPLSLKKALETVRDKHPDLKINQLDRSIAQTENMRIAGILDPTLAATFIASEEKVPVSSDFQASETRLGQLSGSINQPLANGGTVSANFIYNRTAQAFNSPIAAQLSSFNPAFRSQMNVSYRHALLKGADRPDYHQSLLVAETGVKAVDLQAQVIMQTLSLQTINAFYQLAADDINIHIAKQAVTRANKLLRYQRSREKFGLIEKADRLQAEALLAARHTDHQKALAQRFNDQSNLNRLMLRRFDTAITIVPLAHAKHNIPSISKAMQQAEQLRPELQLLKAQMDIADAQLLIALDNDQMQLDVIAEAGTRALANNAVRGLSRGLEVHDPRYYIALSFELSDVLGRNTTRASIRKAELQRQRIVAQGDQIMAQINDDIAAASSAIRAGIPTLAMAKKQEVAEQRKFNAEMQRYRQGRSDTATLVQFEGELRNASLNAELQQLSLQLADTQLTWAQGKLLSELGLHSVADSPAP
ncbi:MAG: TolC family protein [Mariprofundus sp.]|nr:TolC family protein [Mariprofundus sp.]